MKRLKNENEEKKKSRKQRSWERREEEKVGREGELEKKLSNSVIKESTPFYPKVLYLVVFLI